MATMAEYLQRMRQGMQGINQGMQGASAQLERGFENPMFHLGLGMMSGSQQGDPFGGAMQGMQTYGQFARHAMMNKKLKKEEEAEEQAKAMRQAQMAAIKGNPQLMEQLRQHSPLMAATIEAGGMPDVSEFKDPLATKPTTPHQKAMEEMWGVKAGAEQRRADIAEQRLRQDYDQFVATHGINKDKFGFELYKQQVAQQEKAAEKEQTARVASVDLDNSLAKLDNLTSLVDSITKHPSFEALYSPAGQIADVAADFPMLGAMASKGLDVVAAGFGSGVPDLRNMRNQFVDKVVFEVINEMKTSSPAGATGLGQIAIPEFQALQRSGSRVKDAKTPEAAREAFDEFIKETQRVRQNMIDRAAAKAPGAAPSGGAPTGARGGLSPDRVRRLAEQAGIPYEEAVKRFEAQGLRVGQ